MSTQGIFRGGRVQICSNDEESHVTVIFGNGASDRRRIKSYLGRYRNRYCDLRLYFPEPNITARHEINKRRNDPGPLRGGLGLSKSLSYVKSILTKRTRNAFMLFIDTEHIGNNREHIPQGERSPLLEGVIRKELQSLGFQEITIEPMVNELHDDSVFKVTAKVGDKRATVYLILLGDHCCMEEEILGILRESNQVHVSLTSLEVNDPNTNSCCKPYKDVLRNSKGEEYMEGDISEHFFRKIEVILREIDSAIS